MRVHLTLTTMAAVKKTYREQLLQRIKPSHSLGGMSVVKPRWKAARRALETLSIELLRGPATPLLSLGAEKIATQTDTCPLIFRAAPLTIGKTQNPPKCPWQKNEDYVYISTLKCCSATKQKERMTLAAAWIHQEIITLQILLRAERTDTLRCHVRRNLWAHTDELTHKMQTESQAEKIKSRPKGSWEGR